MSGLMLVQSQTPWGIAFILSANRLIAKLQNFIQTSAKRKHRKQTNVKPYLKLFKSFFTLSARWWAFIRFGGFAHSEFEESFSSASMAFHTLVCSQSLTVDCWLSVSVWMQRWEQSNPVLTQHTATLIVLLHRQLNDLTFSGLCKSVHHFHLSPHVPALVLCERWPR